MDTLRALLLQAKSSKATFRCWLVTGDELEIVVGAIGENWFSGESIHADNRGAVVLCSSVSGAWIEPETESMNSSSVSVIPLSMMFVSLQRLSKLIHVVTVNHIWRGTIVGVKKDALRLRLIAGGNLWVPNRAILWVAVL